MVLQRAPDQAVVFGDAAPGAAVVTIHLCCPRKPGQQYVTAAAGDGSWRQMLPAMQATTVPQLLLFSASKGSGTPSFYEREYY
jgi:hypothetical protein